MVVLQRFLARLLPAALMAGGVTLVAAGLLSYTAPPVIGEDAQPSPPVIGGGAPQQTARPTATPAGTPDPGATPTPEPTPTPPAATRIRIRYWDIDLPIISGAFDPPGNDGYPLCNVAQYLTQYRQPSQEGTTYIFSHARRGMFWRLLLASQNQNGERMKGQLVEVWTEDAKKYIYEIFKVKRHSTDFEIADLEPYGEVKPGEQRLVLQTSEGPRGTVPKLQVAARLLDVQESTPEEALPTPEPQVCT